MFLPSPARANMIIACDKYTTKKSYIRIFVKKMILYPSDFRLKKTITRSSLITPQIVVLNALVAALTFNQFHTNIDVHQ